LHGRNTNRFPVFAGWRGRIQAVQNHETCSIRSLVVHLQMVLLFPTFFCEIEFPHEHIDSNGGLQVRMCLDSLLFAAPCSVA
jgi:hypothetical protein